MGAYAAQYSEYHSHIYLVFSRVLAVDRLMQLIGPILCQLYIYLANSSIVNARLVDNGGRSTQPFLCFDWFIRYLLDVLWTFLSLITLMFISINEMRVENRVWVRLSVFN